VPLFTWEFSRGLLIYGGHTATKKASSLYLIYAAKEANIPISQRA
jgi:hypothetical protein